MRPPNCLCGTGLQDPVLTPACIDYIIYESKIIAQLKDFVLFVNLIMKKINKKNLLNFPHLRIINCNPYEWKKTHKIFTKK